MTRSSKFVVGQRVRFVQSRGKEHGGVIVDYFGNSAGHGVTVGNVRISEPGRRWAVHLDDGRLVFADSPDLRPEMDV